MKYVPDAQWHQLIADLVKAAHDPADPETAVAEVICAHVAPECARADIETENRAAFGRYIERETRASSGYLDLDQMLAEMQAKDDQAA